MGRRYLVSVALTLCALFGAVQAAAAETLSHGRFRQVQIYRPVGPVKHVVLLLSGDGGWNRRMTRMVAPLVADGALVVGIDTPELFATLEADDGSCVFPDGDLENLSHFVQAYYKLPTYFTPLLVGYSSGATLAYAMIAQAPPGLFAGAVSLSFCADLDLKKPLCVGESFHFTALKGGEGVRVIPASKLHVPWVALHGDADSRCAPQPRRASSFRRRVRRSSWICPRSVTITAIRTGGSRSIGRRTPPSSTRSLSVCRHPRSRCRTCRSSKSRPRAAARTSDTFAVLLSGDGGWAGLDKEVAAALAARGIPVAGIDSLRYFWQRSHAGRSRAGYGSHRCATTHPSGTRSARCSSAIRRAPTCCPSR